MKSMTLQGKQLMNKVNALSLRERIIVFAALALTLVMGVHSLVLEPTWRRHSQLAEQMAAERLRSEQLQREIHLILNNPYQPDQAVRDQLLRVREEADELYARLQDMQKGLVAPGRMTALLHAILKREGNLRLVSMKTLPTEGLQARPHPETAAAMAVAKGGDMPAPIVYQHGVEITVQGEYHDIVRYMAQLEALPWQFLWEAASFTVNAYPTSTLRLRLSTLSLDKDWVSL